MARIGLLTFSDGRDFVHQDLIPFLEDIEQKIVDALTAGGHEVIRGQEPIWTNELATREGRRVADARPDLTILNIPVWAFPHFTMLAVYSTPGAILLFSTLKPQYPGMVGMLAAAGGLDQIGRTYGRAWGDISDPAVCARIEHFVHAAASVRELSGSTFGRVGGRPMGMYTAVSHTDQWLEKFGIDVRVFTLKPAVPLSTTWPRQAISPLRASHV